MCGIVGVIRWNGSDQTRTVKAMTRALAHRGPDAEGFASLGPATFGHRRLSIIDLDCAANQPMIDKESGNAIAFNGEVYNYKSLRSELMCEGDRFSTQSDTEVLLKGLTRHGMAFLSRTIGMFSIGFWDANHRRLLLSRDRLGKKPLYYHVDDSGISFASELTSLRHDKNVPSSIDDQAVSDFLGLGYIPSSRCIISGVQKLPPGHFLCIEEGKSPKLEQWWDLARVVRGQRKWTSIDEAIEETSSLIDDAVACRLVSDVPLGAFLSGGVDSAMVAEVMRRKGPTEQVKTYTIDFNEDSFSEGADAAESARILSVSNEQKTLTSDIASTLPEVITFCDEPFADTSIIPFYHLSRLARDNVTVALSGDGGDELFAGYETYVADKLHRTCQFFPETIFTAGSWFAEKFIKPSHKKVGFDYKLRQFLAGHNLPLDKAHLSWRTLFGDAARRKILREDVYGELNFDLMNSFATHLDPVQSCDWLSRVQYFDIKTWLVDDVLVKVDRMSMAHGLEVRAPLLDHRLVELAFSMPSDWRLRGIEKRYIFNRLAKRRLPSSLVNRKKKGFGSPIAKWLLGPMRELGRSASMTRAVGEWVNIHEVERLWVEHDNRSHDHSYRLFSIICLGLWLDKHQHVS